MVLNYYYQVEMVAVFKNYQYLNMWKMIVPLCKPCVRRNILIATNSVTYMCGESASNLSKVSLQSTSQTRHDFVCRYASSQRSILLSVPLYSKFVGHCLRHYLSVAVAVGLLIGWSALETSRCVAEAPETTESCDGKEQKSNQCPVISLDEAICESDQLLQREKVIDWKIALSAVMESVLLLYL